MSKNRMTWYDGCRSPYGERGLKFGSYDSLEALKGRSPYGERGLKYGSRRRVTVYGESRSPYGERGLK